MGLYHFTYVYSLSSWTIFLEVFQVQQCITYVQIWSKVHLCTHNRFTARHHSPYALSHNPYSPSNYPILCTRYWWNFQICLKYLGMFRQEATFPCYMNSPLPKICVGGLLIWYALHFELHATINLPANVIYVYVGTQL